MSEQKNKPFNADEIEREKMEREKFFELFNIFVHEVKYVDPRLFPACLEIEEMMNDTFRESYNENGEKVV
ncbi:asparaginase [Paenibacillus melissococcoides]|uniref:Asparaginase n=1 Tax=Paenibacillus melissococcoides TaxID=2912268 RepID=A0ABN8U9A7_9BACL|nr:MULTISPECIES: asparaginase [Paenibacillus]MEB9892752.1 asparaginase [Bacillus cereus]CAH8247755.1 asparaginase [Paenibacillus melissococcoides]CAH8719633.1 asparaginase [Paenibacillus melissococcoides]CAH8720635.1 asparaginase [Paenibacillus melissococcoides]GIO82919.1 hypothetical protein J6TS7_65290 [Paenibacillus dendritiformis]